jgi:hypothetical protein
VAAKDRQVESGEEALDDLFSPGSEVVVVYYHMWHYWGTTPALQLHGHF